MVWCHSVIRFPTMTKALLTAAGISWLYLRDENITEGGDNQGGGNGNTPGGELEG